MASSSGGHNGSEKENFSGQMEVLAERFKGGMVVSVKEDARKRVELSLRWAVVMKLSFQRSFKFSEFVSTLKKAWELEKFTVTEAANGVMVVKFANNIDMERDLEEGPWSFRGATVLMKKWSRGCIPETSRFEKLCIWVQVHNLPFEYRDPDIAEGFAALAGKVTRKMKPDPDAQKVIFVRMKVEMELDRYTC